jgi:hypothetical protein
MHAQQPESSSGSSEPDRLLHNNPPKLEHTSGIPAKSCQRDCMIADVPSSQLQAPLPLHIEHFHETASPPFPNTHKELKCTLVAASVTVQALTF